MKIGSGWMAYLPAEERWLADYVSEFILFPAGRHDDQVDSTAQALAWSKHRLPGSSST
jgi:phage terminase large subunit-like protein